MIDGPRIPPASGGKANSLVILLHGYGVDGNDLIDIGRYLAPVLPDSAFVSPHAPQACDTAPFGRQWFPLGDIELPRLYGDVSSAAPALDAFIDAELASHGLSEERLALVGFSQGTMMALYLAPRRQRCLAGVVGYSGLLAGPERLASEMKSAPPMLLVHGAGDTVIPAMVLNAAARALTEAGIAVESHLRPALQHGVDQKGLELGAAFLARVLNASQS